MTTACEQPFDNNPRVCSHCRLAPEVAGLRRCSRLVAESPSMRAMLRRAAVMAGSDASVVILGESGSGKEVLARALHANSPRRQKPFSAINVAAMPGDLLESELFGHVKGAFTGAVAAKRGIMEDANGGTLLLDEIADMPLPMQAKLLRVLQDGEVRRVGDTRAFSVDVRVLCATHRDLAERVERGSFREDLYYRLKVLTLTVPSLRERVGDVMPLARMFLSEERHPTGRFTPAATRALEGSRWPGNVRELQNAVKHGAVLSQGADVDVDHLPEDVLRPRRAAARGLRTLAEVEREHALSVLAACHGRQVEAARVLGIGRNTLWRKLRGWGVDATE